MSFLRVTGKGRSYNDWGYEDKSYGKSTGKGWGKSSYEDSWGGGALEATAVGLLRSLIPLRLRQEQRIWEGQVEQGQRRDSCETT